MDNMQLWGSAENPNVVKEDNNMFTEQRSENIVHGGLEHGKYVTKTKRHDLVLISVESHLMHILRLKVNLAKSGSKVELGED